jgi:hypothetical protein
MAATAGRPKGARRGPRASPANANDPARCAASRTCQSTSTTVQVAIAPHRAKPKRWKKPGHRYASKCGGSNPRPVRQDIVALCCNRAASRAPDRHVPPMPTIWWDTMERALGRLPRGSKERDWMAGCSDREGIWIDKGQADGQQNRSTPTRPRVRTMACATPARLAMARRTRVRNLRKTSVAVTLVAIEAYRHMPPTCWTCDRD